MPTEFVAQNGAKITRVHADRRHRLPQDEEGEEAQAHPSSRQTQARLRKRACSRRENASLAGRRFPATVALWLCALAACALLWVAPAQAKVVMCSRARSVVPAPARGAPANPGSSRNRRGSRWTTRRTKRTWSTAPTIVSSGLRSTRRRKPMKLWANSTGPRLPPACSLNRRWSRSITLATHSTRPMATCMWWIVGMV